MTEITNTAKVTRFEALDPDLVLSVLRVFGITRKRFSQGQRRHYIAAIKSYSAYVAEQYSLPDPLAKLERQKVRAKTIHRRALTPEEFTRFIEATRRSKIKLRGMTGYQRSVLYLTAASTGFRASELASLTIGSFDLALSIPTVTIESERAKNRLRDTIPIPRSLAEELRTFFEGKRLDEPSFPSWGKRPWSTESWLMVQRDLRDAGIPYRTTEGQFDFHALRVQFATDLARAGISLQEAQRLMRLSNLSLLLGVYTKLGISDLSQSVDRLRAPTPKAE